MALCAGAVIWTRHGQSQTDSVSVPVAISISISVPLPKQIPDRVRASPSILENEAPEREE
jgi:hypothetical protein